VGVIRPTNAEPDGQLHRSWQPSAASALSFVKAQWNTAQEFVYGAVRKSSIINPTLARLTAGREGVGITVISRLDTLDFDKSGR
jgi:hypothetical protein